MVSEAEIIEEVYKKYDDPELGIDVWTLGLIYGTTITDENVSVLLTFTSIMCPYGPQMVSELKSRIKALGVNEVEVEVTFEPPWEPTAELREMMGV
jgi:metal-sulfur cluster biosynthetic enzyme